MEERRPVEEIDFERYGQWISAEHPDKDTIQGWVEVKSSFGDPTAWWLHPVEGPKQSVFELRDAGFTFYRMAEPVEGAYQRGVRDGMAKAREELDRLTRAW